MKPAPLLLAASLVANAALVALLVFRGADSLQPGAAPSAARPASADRRTADATKNEALLAALASGDSAALAAAGASPEVINQLAAARAFGRLAKLAREQDRAAAGAPSSEYWRRNRAPPQSRPTREQRAERAAAERELESALRAAFGDDPFGNSNDRQAFLSPTTREKLRRIERDYDEMQRDVSGDSEGVQLAADREKRRLLEIEKQRDIAAALSPAEREQYELRASNSANQIINRYGDILASEDEYKRLFAIQKAFDDKYSTPEYQLGPRTPADERQRAQAEKQLNDDLRAALGNDRWAAVPRESDNEYRSLTALATRLSLPAATPEQIYAVRDTYAARSQAINQNTALSAADRRKQFTELATQAKAELGTKLGTDGADAYVRSAGWVNTLQGGSAFTTDARQLPAGTPRPTGRTAFPLPPPPAPAAPKP